MKLYKAVLMMVGMFAISGLGLVGYSYSANLGLLVSNSASLDAEEQAAYDFAQSHGFSVAKLDPTTIQNNPSIVNSYDGYWADNGSIPTGFNNQAVIQPLLNAINSGKGILFRQYGGFIGQYLGLGTATTGYWCPVYADADYFVQALDNHPVFDGIPTWLDHALPNKPEQLIYRVNAGCKTGAGINLTNAQVFDIVKIVEAWSPNGHDVQQGGYVFEKSVGQGIVLYLPINGFTLGTLGPVGEKMCTNALNYICSGGQPPQGKNILSTYNVHVDVTPPGLAQLLKVETLNSTVLGPSGLSVKVQYDLRVTNTSLWFMNFRLPGNQLNIDVLCPKEIRTLAGIQQDADLVVSVPVSIRVGDIYNWNLLNTAYIGNLGQTMPCNTKDNIVAGGNTVLPNWTWDAIRNDPNEIGMVLQKGGVQQTTIEQFQRLTNLEHMVGVLFIVNFLSTVPTAMTAVGQWQALPAEGRVTIWIERVAGSSQNK
ncbi:MAG: hypothetical protein WCE90_04830 [Candidatus Zixiibacteriota bacterium]